MAFLVFDEVFCGKGAEAISNCVRMCGAVKIQECAQLTIVPLIIIAETTPLRNLIRCLHAAAYDRQDRSKRILSKNSIATNFM
jgi:hypothetical protein